jgi:hypothetical protein
MLERMKNPQDEVSIGLVGKYVEYEDSYKSLKEALLHGGLAHRLKVNITGSKPKAWWARTGNAAGRLRRHPGARRLRQARHRRHDQRHPLRARAQGAVLRHLPGHADPGDRVRAQRLRPGGADSTEFNPGTPHRVIFKLRELKGVDELGGTMRLGSWPCRWWNQLRLPRLRHARDSGAPPPSLRIQPRVRRPAEGRRACASPARRPTAPTSRSARSPTIPGSWAASSIPNSSPSPWSRIRCSKPSSARLRIRQRRLSRCWPSAAGGNVLAWRLSSALSAGGRPAAGADRRALRHRKRGARAPHGARHSRRRGRFRFQSVVRQGQPHQRRCLSRSGPASKACAFWPAEGRGFFDPHRHSRAGAGRAGRRGGRHPADSRVSSAGRPICCWRRAARAASSTSRRGSSWRRTISTAPRKKWPPPAIPRWC